MSQVPHDETVEKIIVEHEMKTDSGESPKFDIEKAYLKIKKESEEKQLLKKKKKEEKREAKKKALLEAAISLNPTGVEKKAKTVSPWNIYVKENFARLQKEHPSVSNSDIIKMLSAERKEKK